jgi:hypothetical protein
MLATQHIQGMAVWLKWIKNIVAAALGLFVLISLGVAIKGLRVQGSTTPAGEKNLPLHVVVFYFHCRQRCEDCLKFETYARAALETGFAAELNKDLLEFRVLNREDPANEHYVHDFQLLTQAVVAADFHSGKLSAWKNLTRIWELVNDKPKFIEYVQAETRQYLEDRP